MHLDSQFLIFIPSAAKESGHLDLVIIFTARLKINPGTGKIAQQGGSTYLAHHHPGVNPQHPRWSPMH